MSRTLDMLGHQGLLTLGKNKMNFVFTHPSTLCYSALMYNLFVAKLHFTELGVFSPLPQIAKEILGEVS